MNQIKTKAKNKSEFFFNFAHFKDIVSFQKSTNWMHETMQRTLYKPVNALCLLLQSLRSYAPWLAELETHVPLVFVLHPLDS